MGRCKFSFSSILLSFSLVSASTSFAASTYIDTKLVQSHDGDGFDRILVRDAVRSDLSAGVYDKLNIEVPVIVDEEALTDWGVPASSWTRTYPVLGRNSVLLSLNHAVFAKLPSSLQNKLLDRFADYYTEAFVATYEASVNTATNRLDQVGFFRKLGVNVEALYGKVPAENLLSAYAQNWAYETSLYNGPNCWHTAIASTNLNWKKHRYMNPEEYKCHIKTSYVRVSDPSKLEFGDVLSLYDNYGEQVHAFVYLGPDSQNPNRHIVFTKNGYMRGKFLFEDLYTVVNYIYPDNQIEYFRPYYQAVDPSDHSGTACDNAYHSDLESYLAEHRREPDPIIAAGLRKLPFNSQLPLVAD